MDIQTLFDHFDEQFVATGELTPAHGSCFVHRREDVCAVVYRDKTRLYYHRRNGFEGYPKWPCFYRQREVFLHGK
jgi:hypothetical protein